MNKTLSNVLFAVLLTLVMNGLDITYHLATDWAVHINYVAVKLTVVFLATFLIVQFSGKVTEQGIVTSIIGPFMFYLYYLSANPTINRELFKIDEQFWFFFLHFAFMMIAYFSAQQLFQATGWRKNTGFVILTTVGALALDAIFVMARLKVLGLDEEAEALFMTFGVIVIPLVVFLVASVLLLYWKGKTAHIIVSLLAGLALGFITGDVLHGVAAAISFFVIYWTVHHVDFQSHLVKGLTAQGWTILGVVTLLVGGFYHFVPRKTVRSIAEFLIFDVTVFGYKIRQNDIIMVSTLLLVIALVSFYQLYKTTQKSVSQAYN
ncbi:hypothetical protein J4207_03710 [Candidatus Woesearchaeota archaeon]|nr:hypothetical protein [Candidatus Woesearchaeota archaeon]